MFGNLRRSGLVQICTQGIRGIHPPLSLPVWFRDHIKTSFGDISNPGRAKGHQVEKKKKQQEENEVNEP